MTTVRTAAASRTRTSGSASWSRTLRRTARAAALQDLVATSRCESLSRLRRREARGHDALHDFDHRRSRSVGPGSFDLVCIPVTSGRVETVESTGFAPTIEAMTDRRPAQGWAEPSPAHSPQLSDVRLEELLREMLDRVGAMAQQRRSNFGSCSTLWSASRADLELPSVLERIVRAACKPRHARYKGHSACSDPTVG